MGPATAPAIKAVLLDALSEEFVSFSGPAVLVFEVGVGVGVAVFEELEVAMDVFSTTAISSKDWEPTAL